MFYIILYKHYVDLKLVLGCIFNEYIEVIVCETCKTER